MWNEHCSYKSSRIHLKKLHTSGKQVIQGPGENAGVIDIGDDDAIVSKLKVIITPLILNLIKAQPQCWWNIKRCIYDGARPIALLNSIHFGAPEHPKTKSLLNGVVSGIGGYGNCIGFPQLQVKQNLMKLIMKIF